MSEKQRIPRSASGWFLQSAASVLKDELLDAGLRHNACIAATSIAVDVFAGVGIEVEPLVVNVAACNPPFVKRCRERGMAGSGQELDRWFAEDGAYLHCLGIGETPSGQWSGHLVTIIQWAWMLDLTIDQVNRAEYGLLAPKFLIQPVTNGFLDGEERLHWAAGNGAEFIYEARPHDTSYSATQAWKQRKRVAPIVQRTLARIGLSLPVSQRSPRLPTRSHPILRPLLGAAFISRPLADNR